MMSAFQIYFLRIFNHPENQYVVPYLIGKATGVFIGALLF